MNDDPLGIERWVEAQAYVRGWNRSLPMDDVLEGEDDPIMSPFEAITDSAQYANHILPSLRQLAGYNDPLSVGTFTDPPTESARRRFDRLVDMFRDGYNDRAEGREFGAHCHELDQELLEGVKEHR